MISLSLYVLVPISCSVKMGNSCECVSRQTDDAEDALLSPEFDGDQPRGPPPPYQVHSTALSFVCAESLPFNEFIAKHINSHKHK